mmetsp:Transcript_10052/g.15333  ORF Transcript_10052/g.15333 Transcript_10052/m.15333 type:complete len:129 (-) Transcript_10052:849-1235(-)
MAEVSSLEDVSNLQLSDKNEVEMAISKDVRHRAHDRRQNPHHDHVPSDEMDLLIATINQGNFGWKADTCKLQKTHAMYDASACEDNLMQLDDDVQVPSNATNVDTTPKKKEEKVFGQGEDFKKAFATA